MVAVTDGGGSAATAFFSTDLGHALITEGNATADRLGAHFTTYTSSAENKCKCTSARTLVDCLLAHRLAQLKWKRGLDL